MSPTSTHVALADGAALAVTVEGAGPPVMLVSGLGGAADFWSPPAEVLARDFQVIRFDQRGIGGSSRGEAACTIDLLAEDCLAVADALGIGSLLFAGHSTGGCIGQAFARLAPERLTGLVLGGAWLKPNRYMAALFAARRSVLDHDPKAYAALGAFVGYPPEWLERNWSVFEAATARPPASESERRVVQERIDALLAFDGSPDIGSIRCPTLVVGAPDDAIVPAFLQEELGAALPRGRLVMLDGGGHFFPVTRMPAFVAALRGFASELP